MPNMDKFYLYLNSIKRLVFMLEKKHCNGSDQRVARQQLVNTVQHATTEEAVLSVDPTDAPVDWLDGNRVICVYCRSVSIPRLYK
jgi:hypothetical protein